MFNIGDDVVLTTTQFPNLTKGKPGKIIGRKYSYWEVQFDQVKVCLLDTEMKHFKAAQQFKTGDTVKTIRDVQVTSAIGLAADSEGIVISCISVGKLYLVQFVSDQWIMEPADLIKLEDSRQEHKSTTTLSCKCGTHSPMGQGHSDWCDLFKQEF